MRSAAMQSLTNDIKARHPGVVIYGIGDAAHQTRPSDHNEDDTPGSKAAQSDADNVPEHRAIDVMEGAALSRDQLKAIIDEVLADPHDRDRLIYINFENTQWSASSGWTPHDNSDDPHPTHAHFSGKASKDEDGSPWLSGGGEMEARKGDSGDNTLILQEKMLIVRPDAATVDPAHPLVADGKYGPNTAWWVSIILTGGPGDYVSPAWFDRLNDMVLNVKLAQQSGGPGGLIPHVHSVPGASVSITGSGTTTGVISGDAVAS